MKEEKRRKENQTKPNQTTTMTTTNIGRLKILVGCFQVPLILGGKSPKVNSHASHHKLHYYVQLGDPCYIVDIPHDFEYLLPHKTKQMIL
jgi:hypothetical protein